MERETTWTLSPGHVMDVQMREAVRLGDVEDVLLGAGRAVDVATHDREARRGQRARAAVRAFNDHGASRRWRGKRVSAAVRVVLDVAVGRIGRERARRFGAGVV